MKVEIDLTGFYQVSRDCDSEGEILHIMPDGDYTRGDHLVLHLGDDDRRVREFIKACIRAYRNEYSVVRTIDGREGR